MEDDRKPPKANGGVATATAPDKDTHHAGEASAHGGRGAAEGSGGKQPKGASGEAANAKGQQDAPAGRQGQPNSSPRRATRRASLVRRHPRR